MSTISLDQITRGLPSSRRLRYRVVRTNPHWWSLTVTLPLRYHFVHPEGRGAIWPAERQRDFKTVFERTAEETWSRRWVLLRERVTSTVRVEVHLELGEMPATRNELWHVFVLPYRIRGAATCVGYDYTGHAPGPRGDEGEVIDNSGPMMRNVAFAQFGFPETECNDDHLRGVALTSTMRAWRQRGTDHEVGHMLGMEHPSCSGNATACYGGDEAQRSSVMGHGAGVRAQDYEWARKCMVHSTGGSDTDWTVEDDRWVRRGGRTLRRRVQRCRQPPPPETGRTVS